MTAEVLGLAARFEVVPAIDDHGLVIPPETLVITMRPCWRKPPEKLLLVLAYESRGVAYYDVVKRT